MKTRITRLTVAPDGEPIFSKNATHIEVEDESGGEFLVLRQFNGEPSSEGQVLRLDADEWPHINAAVKRIIKEMQ